MIMNACSFLLKGPFKEAYLVSIRAGVGSTHWIQIAEPTIAGYDGFHKDSEKVADDTSNNDGDEGQLLCIVLNIAMHSKSTVEEDLLLTGLK
jgi:hypothetical protein